MRVVEAKAAGLGGIARLECISRRPCDGATAPPGFVAPAIDALGHADGVCSAAGGRTLSYPGSEYRAFTIIAVKWR